MIWHAALWTSVVVVAFVQIWTEMKRCQYRQALDAYEAVIGRRSSAASAQYSNRASGGDA